MPSFNNNHYFKNVHYLSHCCHPERQPTTNTKAVTVTTLNTQWTIKNVTFYFWL